jgi:ElaB/YqjD/DUF883 family membrane-anchored ribosome-binding protein
MSKKTTVPAEVETVRPVDMDTLRDDVAVIKQGAKALKDDTVEILSRKAEEAKLDARIKTGEVKNNMHDRYDQMSASAKVRMAEAEAKVRENPLQSIAAAFLAGAAISFLMKRR